MALRVLVADHSESILKAIHLFLEDFTVEVKPFVPSSTKDASESAFKTDILKTAKSFQPDIIFLDTFLSKTNGYEIAKTLKSDEHFKSIPIILMYSSVVGIDQEKLKASGVEGSLEKPFTREQLRAVATKFIKRDELSSALSDLGDEIEFPAIEGFESEIIKKKPSEHKPSSNKKSKKPEALITSASELEELQKSLSESDGEEEFQQVNLKQISPSEDKIEMPSLDLSQIKLPEDSSPPGPDQAPDLSNRDQIPTPEEEPIPEESTLDEANIPDKLDLPNFEDLQDQPTAQASPLTPEMASTEFSKIDKTKISEKQPTEEKIEAPLKLEVNKKEKEKKSEAQVFQLNIPEEAIDADSKIGLVEPEEEITHINFLTAPEDESDQPQTDQDKTQQPNVKKMRLEQIQEKLREVKTTKFVQDNQNQPDQNQQALQDQIKEAISSKKEIQAIVQDEVKKMVQDQVHRFLRDDLSLIAKKLIKEEIDRLISENPS